MRGVQLMTASVPQLAVFLVLRLRNGSGVDSVVGVAETRGGRWGQKQWSELLLMPIHPNPENEVLCKN